MIRRIFFCQHLLFVSLCFASCAFCFDSYRSGRLIGRYRGQAQPEIHSDGGKILVLRQAVRSTTPEPVTWTFNSYQSEGNENISRLLDFYSSHGLQGREVLGFGFLKRAYGGERERLILLPWWAVASALFALALLTRPSARKLAEDRRRHRGQCQACGYDLRSSPQRCPECGRENDPGKPRRIHRSDWMAAASLGMVTSMCVGLAWWSNPFHGAPAGRGANTNEGIWFYPPWEDSRGTADDRMLRRDPDWGDEWYQAMWHRPDGDYLVILEGPGVHMFWDFWSVTVLDRSFHIVRKGQVGLPQMHGNPKRLAEIHIRAENRSDAFDGKWVLCVCWNSFAPPNNGDKDDGTAAVQQAFSSCEMNPVLWEGDPSINNFTEFKNRSDQIRSAETASR